MIFRWIYLQIELKIEYKKRYSYYHVQYTLLQRPDIIAAYYWETKPTCMLNAYIVGLNLSSADIQYMVKFFSNCLHFY